MYSKSDVHSFGRPALQAIGHFNHNTNLLIAGRAFTVLGEGETAGHLRHCLTLMGARKGSEVLFLTEPINKERLKALLDDALSAATTDFPLLVADAIGDAARLLEDHYQSGDASTRPGITEYLTDQTSFFLVDCTRSYQVGPAEPRLEWARQFMPVTGKLITDLKLSPWLKKKKIGICLVLEPKTAILALELHRAGADVQVFAPANETDVPVKEALIEAGVTVHADPAADRQQERALADTLLDWRPNLIIDDGAHLLRRAHQRPEVMVSLEGGAEETTSGVRPLRQMEARGELHTPVIAVNDARSKSLFDNLHGTGQTCVFALWEQLLAFEDNQLPAHPDQWAVIGYGPVGEGVARHGRALGAKISVVEVDPVRALSAETDGYQVVSLAEALREGQVIISATGVPDTITVSMLNQAGPQTIFAVAGGVDQEISLLAAETAGATQRQCRPFCTELRMPKGAPVWILAGGHGINYTASEGNPIEIMDLSFGAQVEALAQLRDMLPAAAGVYQLDTDRDQQVARAALEARHHRLGEASPSSHWDPPRYQPQVGRTRTSSPVLVYSAKLVIPVTAPRISDGSVAIRGGRIIHVGERQWVLQALHDQGEDFTEHYWDGVITPGLINAHTHLQYTDMAEVGRGRYQGFEDWANAFDRVYDNQTFDWEASALRGAKLALSSGTTACADVVTDMAAAGALYQAGMHGIAYWEVMGWENQEWRRKGRQQTIDELRAIPPYPGVGVSPHAPYSLEVQPLLDVPDLVRSLGMRLHIHLGEARFERETARDETWHQLGSPSFKDLRDRGVGVSSTQFVDQLGVLGPDCHIAHGVYMTDRDRSLLRTRGTSVALCPRSNEVIGLDMPPIADYLNEGNQICVGTDSLSSSPSLDLLEDVAALFQIARQQGYHCDDLHQRLLVAATLGGAGAIGMRAGSNRAGQLAVGALADLAFFAIDDHDPDDALAHLVEAGAGSCHRTLVAGTLAYERTLP